MARTYPTVNGSAPGSGGGTLVDSGTRTLHLLPGEAPTWTGTTDIQPASIVCNFDGGNGSTTYTDRSTYAHVLTANGGAAQSASGGVFDGVDDTVTAPDHECFDILLDGGDFYIEADVTPAYDAGDGDMGVISFRESNTRRWTMSIAADANQVDARSLVFYTERDAVTVNYILSTSRVVLNNVRQVVAVARVSGVVYLYVDGVRVGSGAATSEQVFTGSLTFGYSAYGEYYSGTIHRALVRRGAEPTGGAASYSESTGAYSDTEYDYEVRTT
jgi:hypothetical protein